jgi:dCTP deaminase
LISSEQKAIIWRRMMTDLQIRAALDSKQIQLEPFDPKQLQPASYDVRLGKWAFASSMKERLDLSTKGLVIVEPGEFAVVESLEHIVLDTQTAGQLGMRSVYAQRGLLLLSGPQIDPGFRGIIVVRVVNLSPKPVALPYEEPFLTVQFFRLSEPVSGAYSGPRQDQPGITGRDIQELVETEGLTLGQVIKTLSTLAKDVSELRGSVSKLSWLVPLVVAVGIAAVSIIVALKH